MCVCTYIYIILNTCSSNYGETVKTKLKVAPPRKTCMFLDLAQVPIGRVTCGFGINMKFKTKSLMFLLLIRCHQLVIEHNYGKSPIFMGQFTINDHFQ